ncbi:MAG: hypothetical protein QM778_38945 [Myxococcales bacterium]
MRSLRALIALAFLLWTSAALAEPANRYGAKGRSVLITGLSAGVTGSGMSLAHPAWGAAGRLTLVHFVRDNFAIGGTFAVAANHLGGSMFANEPVTSRAGGDLDVIGHVPLSPRTSLRFWGWGGVRQVRSRLSSINNPYGPDEVVVEKYLQANFGLATEVLLHLSSSVAVAFGPSLSMFAPISTMSRWDWSLSLGPNVNYSFGAPPSAGPNDQQAKLVPARFAARGRNVLSGGWNVGRQTGAALGFARFVTDHFALGPHLQGGANFDDRNVGTPYWVAMGLQMLAELPLRGRWSLLFLPELDYRYDRSVVTSRMPAGSYGPPVLQRLATSHGVQISGAIVPVFHVFEALVLGVGPYVTQQVRLASSVDTLPTGYLLVGATSVLAGSF